MPDDTFAAGMLGLTSTSARFQFLEPGRLVDDELELVEPSETWIDDALESFSHPLTQDLEPQIASTTRAQLLEFISACPRGHQAGDPSAGMAPGYHFWIYWKRLDAPIHLAGAISLRIGQTPDLQLYLGHVGYNVLPPARGHGLAARATLLLLPLARAHGIQTLWVTSNPDNLASRRTIERLGGVFVETIELPKQHPLRSRGETHKCRYRLDL